jgi:hypothetical protein
MTDPSSSLPAVLASGGRASPPPPPPAPTLAAIKAPFTLSFTDPDFAGRVGPILREHGVVVIHDLFTAAECHRHMLRLVQNLVRVFPELAKDWCDTNAPPGPRSGLFQNLATQLPTVWAVRLDPRVRRVFEAVYSCLRGRRVRNLATSCDGLNVRPSGPPFDKGKDWAHLDQTSTAAFPQDPLRCVQGQVVLSDSDACFRCSPKSVRCFEQICELTAPNFVRTSKATGKELRPGNWNLLKKEQYPQVRQLVEQAGGHWQIPVQEPRGSMILWLSATVHSARLQTQQPVKLPQTPTNMFPQWRGVIYVCFQPKGEVSDKQLARVQRCVDENRTTNHWGEKLFGTSYFRRVFSPRVEAYLKKPMQIYEDFPDLKPQWTPALRALCFRHGPSSSSSSSSSSASASASFFAADKDHADGHEQKRSCLHRKTDSAAAATAAKK